jgi:hypothetical protein
LVPLVQLAIKSGIGKNQRFQVGMLAAVGALIHLAVAFENGGTYILAARGAKGKDLIEKGGASVGMHSLLLNVLNGHP